MADQLRNHEGVRRKMEQKHESDMTSKEKRQAEFRKIRSLKGKARLQYFWMYYKILYFLPFILAGAVWFSLFIYGNMQEKVLLSVAVCDTEGDAEQNTRKMQEDLLAVLGSGDRHETVKLDSSVSSGDDSSSVTKRTVVLGAGNTDVFICSRELYQGYKEQGAFEDWREYLGEEYERYAPYIMDGYLDLSASLVWQKYALTSYQPVCAGVLTTSGHTEQVKKFLEYLFPQS